MEERICLYQVVWSGNDSSLQWLDLLICEQSFSLMQLCWADLINPSGAEQDPFFVVPLRAWKQWPWCSPEHHLSEAEQSCLDGRKVNTSPYTIPSLCISPVYVHTHVRAVPCHHWILPMGLRRLCLSGMHHEKSQRLTVEETGFPQTISILIP